jgi:hypothetical protein
MSGGECIYMYLYILTVKTQQRPHSLKYVARTSSEIRTEVLTETLIFPTLSVCFNPDDPCGIKVV